MDKSDIIFWSVVFIIAILMLIGGYYIGNAIHQNDNLKKELCIKHGFTYVEQEDGINVRDCYNVEDGIIQFYNIYDLNGTKYLMRGIR